MYKCSYKFTVTLENDFDKVVMQLCSLFGVQDGKQPPPKKTVLKVNYGLNTPFLKFNVNEH